MKRLAVLALVVAGTFGPRTVWADASILASTAASTLGTKVAADLVRTPRGGLGVFATRWDSQDFGTFTGYGVRLGWDVCRPLALEARASYLESEEEDWETTLIPLEAALTWRFSLAPHLTPYIGGGVGYYLVDAEATNSHAPDVSDEVAGYFALAGINLALGPVTLFAEAKYNMVGTDKNLHWREDVDAENALDGLSTSAGLKLGF